MLERLQQLALIAWLSTALGLTGWIWSQGHPGWALLAFAFVACAHALALALEFTLLAMVHRGDPTPRASVAQLLRAWIGESLAAPAVFCWRQPFRSCRWPDRLPDASRGRRGLVLIHGFVCNRGLWNPWLARLTAEGIPFVAPNLEPVFGSIDDYVPIIETAVREMERCTGLAPIVVAHSMGGLALRRWYVEQTEAGRIHHAVTIASPHAGTWLARLGLARNARQMKIGSRWLLALAAREPPERMRRFTCFYGHCDNIVFPPSTGRREGADNRHLPGVAHVDMVGRPEPLDEVLRLLTHDRARA